MNPFFDKILPAIAEAIMDVADDPSKVAEITVNAGAPVVDAKGVTHKPVDVHVFVVGDAQADAVRASLGRPAKP